MRAGFVCLFAMPSLKDYTEDLLVVFLGKLLEKGNFDFYQVQM